MAADLRVHTSRSQASRTRSEKFINPTCLKDIEHTHRRVVLLGSASASCSNWFLSYAFSVAKTIHARRFDTLSASLTRKLHSVPGKAWERRMPCRQYIAETFQRNPAGNQPRPAKLASSRKRVLRGVRVTGVAKRRQRVYGLCY